MNIRSFTLLELIITIVILGILATLGYTHYANVVENNRLSEAKVRIGLMRELAHEYYLKNGSLVGIQNSDVGVDFTCVTTDYYRYTLGGNTGDDYATLNAFRCTEGGKEPNVTPPNDYVFYWIYFPLGSHESHPGMTEGWHCMGSNPACAGYPP